jgi:hypothetical protein
VRALLKGVVFVAGLISLVIVGFLWYFYVTYIDETAVAGSAYGYAIGQSKREALEVAVHQFSEDEISGIHIMEPFQTVAPTPGCFAFLESSDRWTVFPAERGNFFDPSHCISRVERSSRCIATDRDSSFRRVAMPMRRRSNTISALG